ncbi:MAG TPA: sulfotransferase domain-containing protein, partial [Solirubrobacterales bacterium]|nr:sulfotransferase domain-containing protein [Solirubrobacterales bacterium]
HERSLISGNGGPAFWQETFAAAWGAFSRRASEAVRTRLGDESLAVRYYAQKSADSWALPLQEVADFRLMCLLRDPRDVWVSSVAFHHRRAAEGDSFLPLSADQSEEELLKRFIEDQRQRLRWLANVEERLGAPVIRYESLIKDLPGEAERIGAWLGVHLDAEAVARRRGEYAGHVTAGSIEQSVGRWRREMSPEVAALFWGAMGSELEQLGFES